MERVHQTLGNMIRTYELEEYDFDYNDPWSSILAECAWAIRSTAHTIMDATPAQLVFGRDMLFDLSFKVQWKEIRKRKLEALRKNMERKQNTKAI